VREPQLDTRGVVRAQAVIDRPHRREAGREQRADERDDEGERDLSADERAHDAPPRSRRHPARIRHRGARADAQRGPSAPGRDDGGRRGGGERGEDHDARVDRRRLQKGDVSR
jgi:hypothetical protein